MGGRGPASGPSVWCDYVALALQPARWPLRVVSTFSLLTPPFPSTMNRAGNEHDSPRGFLMCRACAFVGILLTCWLTVGIACADGPAEAIVADAENKEVKVTDLKLGTGVRRLTWLTDTDTEDAKKGLLVLELREPHSTSYAKGIITYVPVNSVESVKYDYDKQVASVGVKGLAEPLAGTLQYKGINVLTFSGAADGKPTSFSGGAFTKGNIKGVSFAGASPLPARKGVSAWQVQIDQPKAMDPTLKVGELKFLYQFPGGNEVLVDAVTPYKSEPLKLDSSVQSYTTLAVDPNTRVIAAEVQVGDKERVVVLMPTLEKDGKTGTLVGVVGEVEAGWKLFPLRTIKNMKRPKRD